MPVVTSDYSKSNKTNFNIFVDDKHYATVSYRTGTVLFDIFIGGKLRCSATTPKRAIDYVKLMTSDVVPVNAIATRDPQIKYRTNFATEDRKDYLDEADFTAGKGWHWSGNGSTYYYLFTDKQVGIDFINKKLASY